MKIRQWRLSGQLFSLCLVLSAALTPAAAQEQAHHHHDHAVTAAPQPSVDMETVPAEVRAGEQATVVFSLRDQEDRPVRNLAIIHDRILHVIIVSSDFTVFGHVHPEDSGQVTGEMKEQARYPVPYTFPKAGTYLVAVDYAVGESLFTDQFTLDVTGEPQMGSIVKDLAREKEFDGYTVALSTGSETIRAGRDTALTFRIRKGGQDVTDLESYLSAAMHVAVVSSDLSQFIHAHGDKPGAGHGDHMMGHMQGPYGPEIEASVTFPAKGLYKIFGQIMHHGKAILLQFMVEVE